MRLCGKYIRAKKNGPTEKNIEEMQEYKNQELEIEWKDSTNNKISKSIRCWLWIELIEKWKDRV